MGKEYKNFINGQWTDSSNGKTFAKKDIHPLDSMLNHHIHEGNLTAYALGNNLVEYDLTQARDKADYVRMTQCQITGQHVNNNSTTSFSIWWYVGLIVIVAFIILVLVLITRESNTPSEHPMLAQ